MPSNDFNSRLNQTLDFSASASTPYERSYATLKRIVKSIEMTLNDGQSNGPITLTLEPGFQANIGQQLRVVVLIPDKNFRDSLFRAYVPSTGYPIHLDMFREEPDVCNDEATLEAKILEFLAHIRERMATYRDYARA